MAWSNIKLHSSIQFSPGRNSETQSGRNNQSSRPGHEFISGEQRTIPGLRIMKRCMLCTVYSVLYAVCERMYVCTHGLPTDNQPPPPIPQTPAMSAGKTDARSNPINIPRFACGHYQPPKT